MDSTAADGAQETALHPSSTERSRAREGTANGSSIDQTKATSLKGSISASIGSVANPVHFQTPMRLSNGSSLTLVLSGGLRINGPVLIHSSAPITITPIDETSVDIASVADLGSNFVRGWNKLPDELKVRVLSFALHASLATSTRHGVVTSDNFRACYRSLLKPRLENTPEIATLAKEAYYNINLVRLSSNQRYLSSHGHGRRLHFRYPSPAVNSCIRRIAVHVNIRPQEWQYLMRLATGTYGFENVARVYIVLLWGHDSISGTESRILRYNDDKSSLLRDWDKFMTDTVGDGVAFKAGGKIVAIKDKYDIMTKMGVSVESRIRMEEDLKSKITFGVKD